MTSAVPSRAAFWSGVAFFVVVLAAISYGSWHLRQWSADEQQLPLDNVKVNGDLRFVSPSEIEAAIRKGQQASFFELDVKQALSDVEALPWVYRASIRKQWPNHLQVYVIEQQAVAAWNSDMLLNPKGGSFNSVTPEQLVSLPRLYGPQGSEQTALQGFRAMQSLLEPLELGIQELILSERFAWSVTLSNGLTLKMGRSEFIDRLQRFVNLFPLIRQQDKQAQYVDLRYDTGLAVGWQDESNNTEINDSRSGSA